jgi:hypothetical protein
MTENKTTAVDWAKALYTNPEDVDYAVKLSEEQEAKVRKDMEAMEKRFEKMAQGDPLKSELEKRIGAAPLPTFPAAEVPDLATQAFIKELRKEPKPDKQSAHSFLDEASNTMKQRAALRDAEDGERTAAKIAEVFNAITGHEISEADAWMFLVVLKIVRSRNGKYNRDDYVDLAAYAGLLGECESQSR